MSVSVRSRQLSKQHFAPNASYTALHDEKESAYDESLSALTTLTASRSLAMPSSNYQQVLTRQSSDSATMHSALSKRMTTGIGTVAYMAPEIVCCVLRMSALLVCCLVQLRHVDFSKKLKREKKRDKIEYDFAVDVFSFGCVLFEIMVATELHDALKTSKDVQQFVLQGKREQIPTEVLDALDVPDGYVALMNQCWAQHPTQRPHFKDIIVRLQRIGKSVKQKQRLSKSKQEPLN